MEKEATSWDKFGAAIRKKAALSAHTGRRPLSKEVLSGLRSQVLGKDKDLTAPKDWVGLRPSSEDLVGELL